MASAEDIESHLQFLGINVDREILSVELCSVYNLDAEEFVDQWCAYTASNLNGAAPSLDALTALERKELAKRGRDFGNKAPSASTPKNAGVHNNNAVTDELLNDFAVRSNINLTPKNICNDPTYEFLQFDKIVNVNQHSLIKMAFLNILAKSSRSLKRTRDDLDVTTEDSLNTSFEINGTSVTNFADRTNSGTIAYSFGPKHLAQKATFTNQNENSDIKVSLWGESDSWLSPDARYMYEVMGSKAFCLNNLMQWLAKCLIKNHNLEVDSFKKNVTGNCTTYGRICCDSDGKLNAASVLLEGSVEMTNGVSIPLNLSKLPNYSVFPGQVVAVQGTNLNGHSFVAHKLFTNTILEFPNEIPNFKENLQVVVAAGPFTMCNSLSYEPLQEFLKYVKNHKPHVVILIGPFIDVCNENIKDGDLIEDFNTLFENLIENIMESIQNLNTHVILIPSHQDAHHHIVYPTPPYNVSKKYPNLHCFPDPAMINVNGVVIGATSADILFHLGKEEIHYSNKNSDRMGRLVSHIINQQCFYPLYPPNKEICVDHELLEKFGVLQVVPHILILPSNFRFFMKNVNGCIVINPERLSKGFVGGTFARIQINCPSTSGTLSDHMICEVLYI